MSSALSRHAQTQHEPIPEESFYTSLLNHIDSLANYGAAFRKSVTLLLYNTISTVQRPDILVKVLDPIVESNRRLFWFLFSDDENPLSLYDDDVVVDTVVSSVNFTTTVPIEDCNLFSGIDHMEADSGLTSDNKLLLPLNQSNFPLLEESTYPLLGSFNGNNGQNSEWWMPVMASLMITLLPSLLIFLVVTTKRFFSAKSAPSQLEIPKIVSLSMLAFASGGLLGDVALHILPSIFGQSIHSHTAKDAFQSANLLPMKNSMISLAFIGGIFVSWGFELLICGCNEDSKTTADSHLVQHQGQNSFSPEKIDNSFIPANNTRLSSVEQTKETESSSTPRRNSTRSRSLLRKRYTPSSINEELPRVESVEDNLTEGQVKPVSDNSNTKNVDLEAKKTTICSKYNDKGSSGFFGYIKEIGGFAAVHISTDLLHNFTDGLALAAAWSSNSGGSIELGLSTTLAIFFHEIPHELGDIAALVHMANWSFAAALKMQLITSALGSFSGLIVGLLVSSLGSIAASDAISDPSLGREILSMLQSTILPFSAGGFMYMALSIILPQLKTECKGLDGRSISIIVLSAFAGIFLLALI